MNVQTERTELSFEDQLSTNLFQFWQFISQPQKYSSLLRERYGDFLIMNYRRELGAIAFTPEGARQILLGDSDGYDAFWKDGFTGVAGPASIWVLGEEKHRRERQLLVPAFHGSGFSKYGRVIREITNRQTRKFKPGQTVRAIETTLSISLDVIMQIVFGVEDEQ